MCNNPCVEQAHAIVAPFISELARIALPTFSKSLLCTSCDLLFFDRRYSEKEMNDIYGSYRNNSYALCRRQWEPWYTKEVNEAYVGNANEAVAERQQFMVDNLKAAKKWAAYDCVVDVGGDEGQFIPDTIDARHRHVFDVSSKQLREGVSRIIDHEELRQARAGLVIMAHVLEHLPQPLHALSDIHDVSPSGSILYAEVPLDRPNLSVLHRTAVYRSWLQTVCRSKGLLILLDFVTGLSRQFVGGRVPWFGVVKQSEHITYFSAQSLRALLEAAGYTVLQSVEDRLSTTAFFRLGRLGMVAIRN